jgi:hypothetical protein
VSVFSYFISSRFSLFKQNAFSEFAERLGQFKFNFYQLLVPDLLHEFELGVWKAIFTHLVRILHAYGHDAIHYLNSRYVSMLVLLFNIVSRH